MTLFFLALSLAAAQTGAEAMTPDQFSEFAKNVGGAWALTMIFWFGWAILFAIAIRQIENAIDRVTAAIKERKP